MFAQRIRYLRQCRNYRQKEIALLLGLSRSAYTLYETGRRDPSLETLLRLADLYDVSTDYLLGR
ncbi:MAG: helix-turn-helix transcriptional regulator [Lachnospiraceae bacterium]|nr:helix-turn-helix transcriptional regulator [Lachnospiraceae bacterium]